MIQQINQPTQSIRSGSLFFHGYGRKFYFVILYPQLVDSDSTDEDILNFTETGIYHPVFSSVGLQCVKFVSCINLQQSHCPSECLQN